MTDGLIAIDVGGGTQDILVYLPNETIENCPQLVMPSPTRIVAKRIAHATSQRRPVFLHGELMGGGSCMRAVKEHIAAGLPVHATPDAALTFNDDIQAVERMGVIIAEQGPPDAVKIKMGDVNTSALVECLEHYEVPIPGHWAVAVQDHGYSPGGSNRLARFAWYREFIESGGQLERLAFVAPPPFFTRMHAVKRTLPDALVMDTGTAAILGALVDPEVSRRQHEGLVIVNVGNFHMMCALILGERMVGLLEHHTGMLNPQRAARLLERFRQGDVSNEEVLDDGGHGCHVSEWALGSAEFRFTAVTGPHRELLGKTGAHMAIPYGDMMLSGCFGLVEAARKKGILGV
ncbi:MAG: DUF1786 domain-containing protein [Candidatus Abyssubacteria bacterium]